MRKPGGARSTRDAEHRAGPGPKGRGAVASTKRRGLRVVRTLADFFEAVRRAPMRRGNRGGRKPEIDFWRIIARLMDAVERGDDFEKALGALWRPWGFNSLPAAKEWVRKQRHASVKRLKEIEAPLCPRCIFPGNSTVSEERAFHQAVISILPARRGGYPKGRPRKRKHPQTRGAIPT